jgi:CDP-paratose 2-epimerase
MKKQNTKDILKGKKILITGGAGFLGSNLALSLNKRGAHIIICDNCSRRGAELNIQKIKQEVKNLSFFSVEISDVARVIASEKPDLIFHLAAQVAVTTSVESPISDFRINAEGTFNVARIANNYKIPVIYSSTNKVYGDNVNEVPIIEEATRYDFGGDLSKKGISDKFSIDAKHHTPYGNSKLVGELYVREWGGVVNRFSCMYGRYQHGIPDQGWLSYFVIQKKLKKPVTIFGDGKQVRDALHASDVVRLFELQAEHLLNPKAKDIRGQVFSIGGGYKNTISLLELCKKLNIKPSFSNWRPSDQKVFYCDIQKAKDILGWEPKVSLEDGLKDLISWVNHNY